MMIFRHAVLLLLGLLFSVSGFAELENNSAFKNAVAVPEDEVSGYVVRLRLHTADEIKQVLQKAEKYVDGSEKFPALEPIAVILHGPELKIFTHENYQMYKEIVELAARLEAYNVIDVRVCEARMRLDGIEAGDLPAFVDSVPFGPTEEKRLLKKGYQYF